MRYANVLVVLLIALAAAGLVATVGRAQPGDQPTVRSAPSNEGEENPNTPERPGRDQTPGTSRPAHRGPIRSGGPMRPPYPQMNPEEYAERMGRMVGLIERMYQASFNPQSAGLMAIGGLTTDVQRDTKDVIADLENLLTQTKSLGLRNSIRLTLRDLYKEAGQSEKVLEHLRAMVAENDAGIREMETRPSKPMPGKPMP